MFDDPAGRQQAVVEDCAAEAVIEYRFVFVDGILIGTKIIEPVVDKIEEEFVRTLMVQRIHIQSVEIADVLLESRMFADVSRSLIDEG